MSLVLPLTTRPSGKTITLLTESRSACPTSLRVVELTPVLGSQTLSVLSKKAPLTTRPSGSSAIAINFRWCPVGMVVHWPVVTSHTCAKPSGSAPPLTTRPSVKANTQIVDKDVPVVVGGRSSVLWPVWMLHTCRFESRPPPLTTRPSPSTATHFTLSRSRNNLVHSPVTISHTRMVPSSPPLTTLPSVNTATQFTLPRCPSSVRLMFPVAMSHIIKVESNEVLTNCPPGSNAMLLTRLVCP
jgi:hypothetical protein